MNVRIYCALHYIKIVEGFIFVTGCVYSYIANCIVYHLSFLCYVLIFKFMFICLCVCDSSDTEIICKETSLLGSWEGFALYVYNLKQALSCPLL